MTQWKPPTLLQPQRGYRSSIDPWLLAGFALRFCPRSFLDLGCGSGAIAYGLVRALPATRGVAIELGDELVACARHNLARLPVTVLRGDLRSYPWRDRSFDLILCNPPYFELGRAKLSPDPERARARHCLNGDIVAFLEATAPALVSGGRFCLVLPESVFLRARPRLERCGFHLRAQLSVRAYAERGDVLVCAAFAAQPGAVVADEMVLYSAHRHYTAAALRLLAPFTTPVSLDTLAPPDAPQPYL